MVQWSRRESAGGGLTPPRLPAETNNAAQGYPYTAKYADTNPKQTAFVRSYKSFHSLCAAGLKSVK